MGTVIKVENLTKSYSGIMALRSVSFEVSNKQIFGYLGPNGAGKTTTIKILLDLISRDGGVVEVLGYDPMFNRREVLRYVGYTPELPSLPKFLSGIEFLELSGKISGLSSSEAKNRAKYLLELVGLSSEAKKKIGKYSKGMMQKLSIANALIPSPELLILDEPTLGMDPVGRAEVRKIILEVNKIGVTIFLSSHLLGEVERICSHVALIKKGEIVFTGKLDKMLKAAGEENCVIVTLDRPVPNLEEKLLKLNFVSNVERKDNSYKIIFSDDKDYRAEISRIISEEGGLILEMKSSKLDLETAFMRLVGRRR